MFFAIKKNDLEDNFVSFVKVLLKNMQKKFDNTNKKRFLILIYCNNKRKKAYLTNIKLLRMYV